MPRVTILGAGGLPSIPRYVDVGRSAPGWVLTYVLPRHDRRDAGARPRENTPIRYERGDSRITATKTYLIDGNLPECLLWVSSQTFIKSNPVLLLSDWYVHGSIGLRDDLAINTLFAASLGMPAVGLKIPPREFGREDAFLLWSLLAEVEGTDAYLLGLPEKYQGMISAVETSFSRASITWNTFWQRETFRAASSDIDYDKKGDGHWLKAGLPTIIDLKKTDLHGRATTSQSTSNVL